MENLYRKKEKLYTLSKDLKIAKWDLGLTRDEIERFIKAQNEVYNRYIFYKEYIKKRGELKNEIYTKSR